MDKDQASNSETIRYIKSQNIIELINMIFYTQFCIN